QVSLNVTTPLALVLLLKQVDEATATFLSTLVELTAHSLVQVSRNSTVPLSRYSLLRQVAAAGVLAVALGSVAERSGAAEGDVTGALATMGEPSGPTGGVGPVVAGAAELPSVAGVELAAPAPFAEPSGPAAGVGGTAVGGATVTTGVGV